MAKFDFNAYKHEVRMIRQRERRQAARLGIPVEHVILPKVRDIKLGVVPVKEARHALRQAQAATDRGQIRPPKFEKLSRRSRLGEKAASENEPRQITINDLLTEKPKKRERKPREPWTGERLDRQLDRMVKDGRISVKDKDLVKNAVDLWPDLQFKSGKAIRDFIDFVKVRNEKDKGLDFYRLFEWSKAYAELKSVGLKNANQMIAEFDKYMTENVDRLSRAKEVDVKGYSAEEVLDAWHAIYTQMKSGR